MVPDRVKALFDPVRVAMANFNEPQVRAALAELFAEDATFHMCHPLGDFNGAEAWYDGCFAGLFSAIPDLERRDWICIPGETELGDIWLGCAGHYIGTSIAPWLDIPPCGQLVQMRFHEFYRFVGDKIVEVQAIWDIPELMMQSNAWPMSPSLGREGWVPGPASQDGLSAGGDVEAGKRSTDHVIDMLTHLCKHPSQGGPEVMELERFWHPRMNWYGPAGIGMCRGIAGFRNWHQIPFLKAMPDRGNSFQLVSHFFGEGEYVAVTGWPNMKQTITADGWLGIAPSGQPVELRSLDFWRLENGLIRENWVLVDLLHLYDQIGVDVMARMREFNKARVAGCVSYPVGEA